MADNLIKTVGALSKVATAAEDLLKAIDDNAPIPIELHGGERACLNLEEREETDALRSALQELKEARGN